MRKEIQFILAGSLFLHGCSTINARAQSPDTSTPEDSHVLYDPTLTPPSTATLIPTPTLTPYPTMNPTEVKLLFATAEPSPTPRPTEILEPHADKCVLPYKEATMTGLQFMSVIKNNGAPVTEADGTIHRHLGLDFEGGAEGESVVNMCDGELVFSGSVKQGIGLNLGNIVVMKYTYTEEGVEKIGYMRYAHMEQVVDSPPGTIIPKGQQIGLLGHSGGWGPDHAHLHVDMWKEEAWQSIVVDRSHGDLTNEVGYYALGEIWSDNTFKRNLINPRKWLEERLYN